jgi:uncharacterized protein (TIGR00369 family)
MQLAKTDECFVCGEQNRAGIRAPFRSNLDLLCSFCTVSLEDRFQGWGKIVHGGILAALLDEACIYAAKGLGGKAVTAELRLRYFKPVPCGHRMTLFGEVVEQRRRIVRARSRAVLGGEVCVEAEAKLFIDPGRG